MPLYGFQNPQPLYSYEYTPYYNSKSTSNISINQGDNFLYSSKRLIDSKSFGGDGLLRDSNRTFMPFMTSQSKRENYGAPISLLGSIRCANPNTQNIEGVGY